MEVKAVAFPTYLYWCTIPLAAVNGRPWGHILPVYIVVLVVQRIGQRLRLYGKHCQGEEKGRHRWPLNMRSSFFLLLLVTELLLFFLGLLCPFTLSVV